MWPQYIFFSDPQIEKKKNMDGKTGIESKYPAVKNIPDHPGAKSAIFDFSLPRVRHLAKVTLHMEGSFIYGCASSLVVFFTPTKMRLKFALLGV